MRVESLSNENRSLRDELQKLSEDCEKVTSENSSIKVSLTFSCSFLSLYLKFINLNQIELWVVFLTNFTN